MIDPNIALSYHPPASPADVQAKVIGLQNARMQQQAMQQQMQASALELQMKQRAMQDQEIARQAYMDSGGDLTQYETLLMKRGASPQTVFAFKKQLLEQRKELAGINKDELANTAARHDQLRGAAQSFLQQSPDFKAQHWGEFLQQQVKSGNMTPQEYQQHVQSFPQYPGDDQLKMDINSLATGSQLMKEAAAQQNADANATRAAAAQTQAGVAREKADAELPGIKADANKKQRETLAAQLAAATSPQAYGDLLNQAPHGIAQAFPTADKVFDQNGKPIQASIDNVRRLGMTAEQQTQADQAAANANQTKAHETEEERQGRERIGISRREQDLRERTFNATLGAGRDANGQPLKDASGKPLTGEAFLAMLPPGKAAEVKAVAEGRQESLPRGKELDALMQLVNQYDPSYTSQRAQIRKSFTTGNDGRNIGALNTATVHLDQLADAAAAMGNGTFRPGNEVWNRVRSAFGSATPTNFEALKSAVAGEMANALKGNATDVEIHNISQTLQAANSPEQLAGVIKTNLHTLGAKLNTYAERYRQQMPDDKSWSPVLPSAQSVYQKHGIQPVQGQQGGAASAVKTWNSKTQRFE